MDDQGADNQNQQPAYEPQNEASVETGQTNTNQNGSKIEPSVQGIVEKTIEVFKANLSGSILLAGLPTMLYVGYLFYVTSITDSATMYGSTLDLTDIDMGSYLLVTFIVMVLGVILSLRAYIGLGRSTLSYLDNKKTYDFATALRAGAGGAGTLFLASLAYGLLIVLGLIALIIPGLLVMFRYVFVPFLTFGENLSVSDAFKRSKELTNGRFGLIGGLFALMFGLSIVISLVGGISSYLEMLLNFVVAPLPLIGMAVTYKALNEQPAPAEAASDTL